MRYRSHICSGIKKLNLVIITAFRRYPKLRRLRDLKKQLCNTHTHPPFHLSFNTTTTSPRSLTDLLSPYHFDVILLTPPKDYTWPEITAIPVRLLSADPSFVFIWIGKTDHDGLERGREALMKWGFRRCEEIIWVKSNKKRKMRGRGFGLDGLEEEVAVDGENGGDDQPKGLLVNQKEHCLMGIRGTVRRKTDNFFVHCNVGECHISTVIFSCTILNLDDAWSTCRYGCHRLRRGRER